MLRLWLCALWRRILALQLNPRLSGLEVAGGIAAALNRFGVALQAEVLPLLCVLPIGIEVLTRIRDGVPEKAWTECVKGVLQRKQRSETVAALCAANVLPVADLHALLDGIGTTHSYPNDSRLVAAWAAVHARGCAQFCSKLSSLLSTDMLMEAAGEGRVQTCPVFTQKVHAERESLRRLLAQDDSESLGWRQPDAVFPRDASIQKFLRGPQPSMVYCVGGGELKHARNLPGSTSVVTLTHIRLLRLGVWARLGRVRYHCEEQRYICGALGKSGPSLHGKTAQTGRDCRAGNCFGSRWASFASLRGEKGKDRESRH